jgi:outer membrane biosynthesis protein TonB
METFISFLFKASAGIALFYLGYWLFLRNETYHNANRWFLITALLSSVLLPLFPVHYTLLMEQGNNANLFVSIPDTFKHIPAVAGQEAAVGSFNGQQAVLLVYFTGAAIFLLRLLTQTFILIQLIIKHRIKSLEGIRIVENEKYGLPFSFFNVVFINPKFHKQENLPEILAHEKVHIRENHWFDLLFIELLTVIFWFNPFIWFFERSIKQNHEYLADKGVLAQGHHVGRYQALLINQLMGMQIIGVTNNLNFALNTNRLKMMTKTKTSRWLGIKFLWALPALALLLFAFAEPDYQVSYNETDNENVLIPNVLNLQKTVKLEGLVLNEAGEPLPGTSIVIKGTTVGTVTDLNGKFELEVPEKSNIVLSYVGKKTIEDSYGGITSELKSGKGYTRKYVLEDVVIEIHNKAYIGDQPPPPPPPKPAAEKVVKDVLPPPPPSQTGEQEIFYIVEDMPKYPGGFAGLEKYYTEMQQKIARSEGVKGKAKVAFTVDTNGKVTDIKVVEKDNEGVAKGAIQIVSEMPVWTPGKQRGKSVPVKYLLPLAFN